MNCIKEGTRIFLINFFGCKLFVLNIRKDNIGKFDVKVDGGILLGYSTSRKTFRVFNKRTIAIEESIHAIFDESNPLSIEIKFVNCTCIL